MSAAEPLKSAMTNFAVEDTSLALPSDGKLRSGHQRVLDQVSTIKRGKSKKGKNDTLSTRTLSPTSPETPTKYEFGSFKFSPTKANGGFSRFNSVKASTYNKTMGQTISSRSMSERQCRSLTAWEQQINGSNWATNRNELKTSRSDPALPIPLSPPPAVGGGGGVVMRAKGQTVKSQQSHRTQSSRQSTYFITNGSQMTTKTRVIQPIPSQPQNEGKMGSIKAAKSEQSMVNVPELTLKEAVEYLSQQEESYQLCGATFIQHASFKKEGTKQEVLNLGGVPTLVSLLRSPNPAVNQAAAGALRNLVFKHLYNKMEVQDCGGIAKALQLLKETDSTETQKQVTGLLWNLSSAEELKEELIATALPALTENVVVPFTGWSETTNNNNIHPDVFYNATGCLRNLSWGTQTARQAMRECHGLVDSLMSYIQSCVAEENPDDKSVENCVCILHNLTYQLESESPKCFDMFKPKIYDQNESKKNSAIGCFSPRSNKTPKEIFFEMDQKKGSAVSGANWLCHPTAMQTYLSLLGSSQKDGTLEAACGALQNLTASGTRSGTVSQFLVEKLGAMAYVSPLLKSPNPSLQKTAMSVTGNFSQTSSLQTSLAKRVLPELTRLLSSSPKDMGNCDETVATACNTVRVLASEDNELNKRVFTRELVLSLADLSENRSFPKGCKAASILLYSLWKDKNLQGIVKKLGMDKSVFVNDNTTGALGSKQQSA